MSKKNNTKLCNSISTSVAGATLESRVQAMFVTLMLSGGWAPFLPNWPIKQIMLQAKIHGFETDDLVVFVEDKYTKEERKLLCQVKRSIAITNSNKAFKEFIQRAWIDFNNQKIFNKGKDLIALISEQLGKKDFHCLQWLLDRARNTERADDLYLDLETEKASPTGTKNKLEIISELIKNENNDIEITKYELFFFIKHLCLMGVDLEGEGIVFSLMCSHISQFNSESLPSDVWSSIVYTVQDRNRNAGTITLKNLPDELKKHFEKRAVTMQIPEEFQKLPEKPIQKDKAEYVEASLLALLNLLGGWYDKNEADLSILDKLLAISRNEWIEKLKNIHQLSNSPIVLKDGKWSITGRAELLISLGGKIYDDNLNVFKEVALRVLSDYAPSRIHNPGGAVITREKSAYSEQLRMSIAESLSFIRYNSLKFTNCSKYYVVNTIDEIVEQLLSSIDWGACESYCSLLQFLAEASPDKFLGAVKGVLKKSPCPFNTLFTEIPFLISYLLSGLELLAWDKEYLVPVSRILGQLSSIEFPKAASATPLNSLIRILLPWLPQTLALIEKRKAVITNLKSDYPDFTWRLLINFLPGQHQISFYNSKPRWKLQIPEDIGKSISNKDYWDQIEYYTRQAVELAKNDVSKLAELIPYFDKLPSEAFCNLLKELSSEEIMQKDDEKKYLLWNNLVDFTSRHRRFRDTEWALSEDLLKKIDFEASKLEPKYSLIKYKRFFAFDSSTLFEGNGSAKEEIEKLEKKQIEILKEILNSGGIDKIIHFVGMIESAWDVGNALGKIETNISIDTVLFPKYLLSDSSKVSNFVRGYVWSSSEHKGYKWIDGLDKTSWEKNQFVDFLCFLPFSHKTWKRVDLWLSMDEKEYWKRASIYPIIIDKNSDKAIEKLLKYERPNAAIKYIYRLIHVNEQSINVSLCIQALMMSLKSNEPAITKDEHCIIKLISLLQKNTNIPEASLIEIEWNYLSLLWSGGCHERPITLEKRLASHPDYFSEIVQWAYIPEGSQTNNTLEVSQETSLNAYILLSVWKIPPGTQPDNKFNGVMFMDWFKKVKESCAQSGHLREALNHIGKVLTHCPQDEDGLWINKKAAEILNEREMDDLRKGFYEALAYPDEVQSSDSKATLEKEMAAKYRGFADQTENAGFSRLAETLKDVSNAYSDMAKYLGRE